MKLCPYPFSRLQTSNYEGRFESLRGTFLPCVPSWFKEEHFKNAPEDKLEDIWNGKAAIELRKRMYEGDFSLCNREACQIPLFTVDELADRRVVFAETPIPAENIEAIRRKDPVMPSGPSSLYLTSDYTCNLNCPICRSSPITNKMPVTRSAQEEFEYVYNHRSSLEVIKLANGGEVFYSKLQRKLLKSLNSIDFPNLRRVHIVTNGTLFDQKAYDDLAPGTHFIRDVNISIDAGSKEVYQKVRGPHWDQLLRNIAWMGEMRKAGKFDYLSFHVIVVKDNFHDIPNMVRIAKENGIDRVLLQPFLSGPDQGYKNYEEQAIHLPQHPQYPELLAILDQLKDEPVLYTYLDLPGYQNKISKDVDIQKAYVLYLRAEDALKNDDSRQALDLLESSVSLNARGYAFGKLAEVHGSLGNIAESAKAALRAAELGDN
jgi:MoaA/NifB/PqqE/SkfB family radical SAM enzyme